MASIGAALGGAGIPTQSMVPRGWGIASPSIYGAATRRAMRSKYSPHQGDKERTRVYARAAGAIVHRIG